MATSDYSPTVDALELDTERLKSLQPECPFCGCSLTTGVTEDRRTRQLQTASCRNRDCFRGAAAVLVISGHHCDKLQSELKSRRKRLDKGLRARKLASLIRPDIGLGRYIIERIGPHTFDLRPLGGWADGSQQQLAESVRGIGGPLRVECTGDRVAVRVIDDRFQTGAGEPYSAEDVSDSPLPDGGVVADSGNQQSPPTGEQDIDEQHRTFQRRRPLGGLELAEQWPEKELL